MPKKIIFTIDFLLSGIRLDKALSHCPEIGTRSRAAKLIDLGSVTLESSQVKASQLTETGDVFEIEIPTQSSELEPLDIPLQILFEDSDLLVVNKPAGLVVHPASGHAQDTLVNALLHHTSDLSMGFGENRPGIVHRLDRDTSGLLVVAKNDFAHEKLAQQFRERTVHRIYWSFVVGPVSPPKARIETNLGRHPGDRKKFSSLDIGGKHAITHYQLIEALPSGISLVHVRLETGRTHQIRVHLTEKGFPIVGDFVYGPHQERKIKSQNLKTIIGGLGRIALHAAELGFRHPKNGQELAFRASWPEDMNTFLEAIKP